MGPPCQAGDARVAERPASAPLLSNSRPSVRDRRQRDRKHRAVLRVGGDDRRVANCATVAGNWGSHLGNPSLNPRPRERRSS